MTHTSPYMRIAALLVLVLMLTSCTQNSTVDQSDASQQAVQVVATLFPQYDFVRQVGGDKVDVSLLLPPGVEAHAYEPTPKDIVLIEGADIFVYTGEFMEPWAHKVTQTSRSDQLLIIEASDGIALLVGQEAEDHEEAHDPHEGEDKHEDEHEHGNVDPHIWLDPIYAQKMVKNITEGLVQADPENESYYRTNAKDYLADLEQLHQDFAYTLQHTRSRTIYSGGHFAFGYLTERYGLTFQSPYSGFAPDAEPTPKRIAEMIEAIKDAGISTIYHEELVDPRVAKVIADEANVNMLVLHAAHNLSKTELDGGITYLDIMYDNLENLKIGLGFSE